MTSWNRTLATVVLVLGLSLSHAHANDEEVGAQWFGEWEITSEVTICETEEVLTSNTFTDTICSNDCIETPDEEFESECTTVINGNTIEIECSDLETPIFPGCTADFELTQTYTVSGTTVSGSGQQTVTYSGKCLELEDFCANFTFMGVRIQGPSACSVPVVSASWSELKARFQ